MIVSGPIAELLQRLQELETQVEKDLVEQRRCFRYSIEKCRVHFEAAVRARHKTLRTSVARSSIPATLFSPLVYAVIVPLVLLDFAVTVFQWICCPVYGIPKVRRADFIVVDRHHLAYLNPIEKLNCAYCGYANGVLAYAREIAGRAEAHWCPIKHARRTRGQHRCYYAFADFGDAEGWEQIKADPARMASPGVAARDQVDGD